MRSSPSLAQLLERQIGGADGTHPTAIHGLTFYRFSQPMPPVGVLFQPALCLIAQGAKRIVLGQKEYRYDADTYVLVAADVPAMARVSQASARAPYLGLNLQLDALEVGEVVAQLGPRNGGEGRAAGAMAVTSLDSELLDSVRRLVALLEKPDDALILAPLVRREITYRLLVGPDGPRLRQIVSGIDQGQRISQVLRWLKDHYADPLSIEEVAKHASMSPSAFHRHFKAVTALSPLQYQKRVRLHEARRLMLGEALDAAEVSFRVGYESPSQFNREYRRLFGAPPRKDIETLRQDEAPVAVVAPDLPKGKTRERGRLPKRVAYDQC